MKVIKILVALLLVQISIFFISCASKPIPIPGDKKAQIDNIYIEYLNIADAYFSLEKYDKAITYYELAMNNKKIYWDCYYKLAKCYVFQSKWDESLEMFNKLLKRDSENSSLKESVAYIYAMSGQVEKALKIYDELIKLQPQNQEFLENYIAVLLLDENLNEVQVPFMSLSIDFPDSKNIEKFETQIDLLLKKQETEAAKKAKENEIKVNDEDVIDDSEPEKDSSDAEPESKDEAEVETNSDTELSEAQSEDAEIAKSEEKTTSSDSNEKKSTNKSKSKANKKKKK